MLIHEQLGPSSVQPVGMQSPPQQHLASHSSALVVSQIPNAGRGLTAARSIQPGEVVLREAPLLLTPSADLQDVVCANCLRFIQSKIDNMFVLDSCLTVYDQESACC